MVGETFSLTAIVLVRHFEKEMPLTIYHGREMSTISGNVLIFKIKLVGELTGFLHLINLHEHVSDSTHKNGHTLDLFITR